MIRAVFLSFVTACALAPLGGAQRPPARPRLDSLRARAQRDPYDADAQFSLGMGYWDRRRYPQADSAFRRSLARSPLSPTARLALANLPQARAPEARRLTREAYLLDPLVDLRILHNVSIDEILPRRQIGEVPGGSSLAPGPLWWEGRAKSAVRALIAGRAEEGYGTMRGILDAPEMRRGAVLPDLFIWYFGLAAGHAGRYDDAASAFQELSQRAHRRQANQVDQVLANTRADLLYIYAVMSWRAGRPQVAIPALEEALTEDLGLFQACSRLAEIHEALGDTDLAIAARRRAVATSPETGALHFELGQALLRAGRPIPAESALVVAAQLRPDDAETLWSLGTLATKNGDTAVAREAMVRFVEVAPSKYAEEVFEARRALAERP